MAVELIAWLLQLAHNGVFTRAGLARRLVEHCVGLLTSAGLFCTDHFCLTGAVSQSSLSVVPLLVC